MALLGASKPTGSIVADPTDQVNIRISHSGSKTQNKKDTRNGCL